MDFTDAITASRGPTAARAHSRSAMANGGQTVAPRVVSCDPGAAWAS